MARWFRIAVGVVVSLWAGLGTRGGQLAAQVTLPNPGPYTQNFNSTPGASGTSLPTGWEWHTDLVTSSFLTPYVIGTAPGFYNFGSRVGCIASVGTGAKNWYVLTLAHTLSRTNLRLSFTAGLAVNNTVLADNNATWGLYATTDPSFASLTPISWPGYDSQGQAVGSTNTYSNLALPATLDNQAGEVYLIFEYTATGSIPLTSGDGIFLDNISLSYDLIPLVANLGPDIGLCPGQQALLSVATFANVGVEWSDGSTAPTFLAPGPGTYWVTLTDGLGRTASDTVTLSALPAPTGAVATAHPASEAAHHSGTPAHPDSLCAGLAVAYEVQAPTGFTAAGYGTTWQLLPGSAGFAHAGSGTSPAGVFTLSTANGTLPVATLASAYADGNADWVFTAVVQNLATGCTDTLRRWVHVRPAPAPTFLPAEARFCPGESLLTLDASSATADTYTWTPGGETTPTLVVTSVGVYGVTVRGLNGCEYTASTQVVNETFVLDLGPDASVCLPHSLNATYGGPQQGVTYAWSTGATTPTLPTPTSGTYAVLITTPFGCTFTDTVLLVVNAPPVSALAPAYTTCANVPVTLTPATPSALHLWSTGATTPSIQALAPGTYWVRITLGACVVHDTTTLATLPVPSPNLGPDRALCRPAYLETGLPDLNGHSVLWSLGYTTPTMQVLLPGTFAVEVTDANGCTGRDTVTVTLRDTLHLNLTATPQPAMVGQPVNIDAQPTSPNVSGATWHWTMGNGDFSLIQGGFSYAYPTAGTYPLVLTFNDGDCQATDTLWVTVEAPTGWADAVPTVNWVAYPNPATHTLWLRGAPVGQTWVLADATGRLVASGTVVARADTEIDLSSLPTGVYLLRVGNGPALRLLRTQP